MARFSALSSYLRDAEHHWRENGEALPLALTSLIISDCKLKTFSEHWSSSIDQHTRMQFKEIELRRRSAIEKGYTLSPRKTG